MATRILDNEEHWLFAGIRVTDADNNDIDQADLIFAELGQGPVTGATMSARADDDAGGIVVPRTNNEGIPPRFWLPAPAADASADGGTTWIAVGTVDRAAERQAALDAASAAELAAGQASTAQQQAEQAASTVSGFSTRLTNVEQEAAKIGPAVTQAQVAASQAVQAANQGATFDARITDLEQNGTGGTGGGKVFPVWTVNGAWEYTSLAAALAAGYESGQTVEFYGTASGPDWAPRRSIFHRSPDYNITA